MRVVCLISTAAVAVAGCSGERIVTTDEPRPAVSTGATAASAPLSNAHLVDAFDYVAHLKDSAVYYFTTPSGRWACAIVPRVQAGCQSAGDWRSGMRVAGAPQTVLDASGADATPNAVVVERDGDPRFASLEAPEFVLDTAKVLMFNRILAVAGFRCNVQEAGVSCMSEASGKGFTFAPEGFAPQYTDVPAGAP